MCEYNNRGPGGGGVCVGGARVKLDKLGGCMVGGACPKRLKAPALEQGWQTFLFKGHIIFFIYISERLCFSSKFVLTHTIVFYVYLDMEVYMAVLFMYHLYLDFIFIKWSYR